MDAPPGPRTPPEARQRVTALYEAHAPGLVKLANIMLGDQSQAEDVVHDAFLGLYRKWPKLHDQDRALGYLRTSVLNGCRTAHRGRTRRAWGGWLIPLAAAVAVIVVAATPVCTISTLFRLPSARGTRVLFAGFRLRGGLQ